MWIGRFNSGEGSDYWISRHKQKPKKFIIEGKHDMPETYMIDFYYGDDIVIVNKLEVEKRLGIYLKPLEQIEV